MTHESDNADHHLDYLLTEPMKAGVVLLYVAVLLSPVAIVLIVILAIIGRL
jgi:hypothetical protein